MWASTTSRRAALAAATLLGLAACSGPRALDTGSPLVAGPHDEPGAVWEKDLGRALEFPPVAAGESWLAVVTEGPLHRVRSADGETLWRRKLPAAATAEPLLCGAVVVLGTEYPSDRLLGIGLDDGKILWKTDARGALPAGGDGLLLAVGRGGWAARFDPATGEETWRRRLAGAGWRAPVPRPAEGLVLAPVRPDSVVALNLADGVRRWASRVPVWAQLSANPRGPVAAAGDDSALVMLDPVTGEVTARAELGAMPAGAPVVAGDLVVVALRNGLVRALRGEDLTAVWVRALDPPLVSAPLVDDGLVVQTAPRGRVHVLELATGAELRAHDHPEKLVSTGAVTGELLAVGGVKGTLVIYRRTP